MTNSISFAGTPLLLVICVLPVKVLRISRYIHSSLEGRQTVFSKDLCAVGMLRVWRHLMLLTTSRVALQAKPLSFLHVFHHSFVVVMAYLWLDQVQSLQQIALMTNAFIHVIMYLYYLLSSLNMHPPWKQLVTTGQIVQFVFR